MPRARITPEVALTADGKPYNREMKKVEDQTRKVQRAIKRAGDRARYMNRQQSALLRTMRRFTIGLGSMLAAFYALDRATRAFTGSLNQLQELENRLRVVTNTNQELVDTQQELFDISRRTRSEINANTRVFSRLALAVDGTGVSLQEVLRLTELIAQTQAIGGTSAQEAFGSSIQFAQGIASDRLSGDELRGVLEGNPVLAQALARGLGVDVGQLRPLGQAGSLDRDATLGALRSQFEEVARQFENVTITISGAAINIGTELLNLTGTFDDVTGISEILVDVLLDLANIIKGINDSFPVRAFELVGRQFEYLAAAREYVGIGGGAAVGGAAGGLQVARNLDILRQESSLQDRIQRTEALINRNSLDNLNLHSEQLQRDRDQLRALQGTRAYQSADRFRTAGQRALGFLRPAGFAAGAVGIVPEFFSLVESLGYGQLENFDFTTLEDDQLAEVIQRLSSGREQAFRDREAIRNLFAGQEATQLPLIAGTDVPLNVGAVSPEDVQFIEQIFDNVESRLLSALAEQFRRADVGDGIVFNRTPRVTGSGVDGATTPPALNPTRFVRGQADEAFRFERDQLDALNTIVRQNQVFIQTQTSPALIQTLAFPNQQNIFDSSVDYEAIQEARINRLLREARAAEEADQALEDFQNEMRSFGRTISEDIVQSLREGADAADIFASVMNRLLDRLLQSAVVDPLGDLFALGLQTVGGSLGIHGFGGGAPFSPAPQGNPFGYSIGPASVTTASVGGGTTINVNGVQDPAIVRREIQRALPQIAAASAANTASATRRPGVIRNTLG